MLSQRYTTPKLSVQIPTYLPLAEAARNYNLSEKVLTQMIQTGKIEAVQLPTGELLVAAEENGRKWQTKEEIINQKYAHLRGQQISASEASRKYSEIHGVPISQPVLSRWAKLKYISVLKKGYRLQLDEADVAYCAEIFAKKYKEYGGQMQGVNIFDEEGNPYELKNPEVAKQKRVVRQLDRQQARIADLKERL